ncbi:hypothetical protein, partial [Blautia wexlerae]|uniref:hypothetical protein n=1 Tax=Blautia wexlerae TaxID=418240 RepID=UPI0034A50341
VSEGSAVGVGRSEAPGFSKVLGSAGFEARATGTATSAAQVSTPVAASVGHRSREVHRCSRAVGMPRSYP